MVLPRGMSVSNGSPMKHVNVSDGSPIRHVSLWWEMSVTDGACLFLIGLQSGMSVSDIACRGLWWVSNQACQSPMKHVEVFDGSQIRHVGLRCSMLRSPIRHVGLQWSMSRPLIRHVGLGWRILRSLIRQTRWKKLFLFLKSSYIPLQ